MFAGTAHPVAFSRRGFLAQPVTSPGSRFSGRYGIGTGRRSIGLLLALAVELLLIALIFTLGSSITQDGKEDAVTVVRFKANDQKPQSEQQEQVDSKPDLSKPDTRPAEKQVKPNEVPAPIAQPRPDAPPPVQIIRLSPKEMAVVDITALPRRPGPPAPVARSAMGPVDSAPPARDTPRISGSAPNGEPLYAAEWYRKPYPDETAGYLSTATGPGWGLIACRTVADYRVEDCVKIDEYPNGSNIARAALGAAWQFRVRPPRIGGKSMIGAWVGIRLEYGFEPKSRY